jgi:S1-C subfamily serine protease
VLVAVPVAVPVPDPVPVAVPVPDLVPAFDFSEPGPEDPGPRTRGRRHDEDDPPVRRGAEARRGSRGNGVRTLAEASVAALVLVGVAVGGYFAFWEPSKPKAEARSTVPDKKEQPPLTPEQVIKKVKASTVLVITSDADGSGGSGSGFFVKKPEDKKPKDKKPADKSGYVVTNAHVVGYSLGYGKDGIEVPTKLEVVVDSGGREQNYKATIYGLDAEKDLALLKVEDANLPPPLTLGKAEELIETQDVNVFGYPYGKKPGKEVTVESTKVSSLRRTNGSLEKVQLAGGIRPGNSGGPVANAKGDVVGVSVSALKIDERIVFAIPAGRRPVPERVRTDDRVAGLLDRGTSYRRLPGSCVPLSGAPGTAEEMRESVT